MTRTEALTLIPTADLDVMGQYRTATGLRFETLSTSARDRTYYHFKRIAKRHGLKVASGEVNNGRGHCFVRISGLTD